MPFLYAFNEKGKAWRHRMLLPLYPWLVKVGLTANRLTFLRAWAGPVFVFLFPSRPQAAVLMMVIAGLLDWLDGGVARYQGRAGDRGKFWDVLVDHANYVFPVFTLLQSGDFDIDILGYHLLIVPVVYLLSVLKESEGLPTDWIIHPYYSLVYIKPVSSLALLLYVFGGLDYVNETLFALNVIASGLCLYLSYCLYRRWSRV